MGRCDTASESARVRQRPQPERAAAAAWGTAVVPSAAAVPGVPVVRRATVARSEAAERRAAVARAASGVQLLALHWEQRVRRELVRFPAGQHTGVRTRPDAGRGPTWLRTMPLLV